MKVMSQYIGKHNNFKNRHFVQITQFQDSFVMVFIKESKFFPTMYTNVPSSAKTYRFTSMVKN